jgi:integrase
MKKHKKRDSLYQRNGIWYMSFTDENGNFCRKSTQTSNRELAAQRLAKTVRDIYECRHLGKSVAAFYTFEKLTERFMAEHAPKRTLSMQKSYRNSLAHLREFFAGKKLADITPALVLGYQEYRRQQDNSRPGTRNRELAMLSKTFSCAQLWGWFTQNNPCHPITKEKEDNENFGRCLADDDEEQRLLNACGNRLKSQLANMVIFDLNCGIREGAVLKLHWSKIDLFKKTFESFNEKAKRWYTVPMSDTVYNLLLAMSKVRSMSGYVFTNGNDKPYLPRQMYREFKKACKEAGLDAVSSFRFHDLRHTVGSRLGRQGFTALQIGALLDQTQLSTVKRYVNLDTESKRDIVAALERKTA